MRKLGPALVSLLLLFLFAGLLNPAPSNTTGLYETYETLPTPKPLLHEAIRTVQAQQQFYVDVWTDKGGQGPDVRDGTYKLARLCLSTSTSAWSVKLDL